MCVQVHGCVVGVPWPAKRFRVVAFHLLTVFFVCNVCSYLFPDFYTLAYPARVVQLSICVAYVKVSSLNLDRMMCVTLVYSYVINIVTYHRCTACKGIASSVCRSKRFSVSLYFLILSSFYFWFLFRFICSLYNIESTRIKHV